MSSAGGYFFAFLVNNVMYYMFGKRSMVKLKVVLIVMYLCWSGQCVLLWNFIMSCKEMRELKKKNEKRKENV